MGTPRPLKTRPIMSRETPRRATSSWRRTLVAFTSRSDVSSSTWITACSSETSSTCPFRSSPLGRISFTIAL